MEPGPPGTYSSLLPPGLGAMVPYKVLNADQGTEREAYTVHCFSRAGYEINAMKDEKKGDYVITKDHVSQTLEVGGKNKNPKEADYVLRDNTDYPVGNAIPFWLMGMMW